MTALVFDVLIVILAGFLDAIGFTYLSALYVSFMSGNSTGLGIAIASGHFGSAVASAAVIGSFVLGAFVGSMLVAVKKTGAPLLVVAVEAVLVASSAVLVGHAEQVLTLLPMGMQNTVPRQFDGVEGGRSYVTGALVGMAKALAASMADRQHLAEAAVHGGTWLALVAGAVGGSPSLAAFGLSRGLFAVALALLAIFARHLIVRLLSSGPVREP